MFGAAHLPAAQPAVKPPVKTAVAAALADWMNVRRSLFFIEAILIVTAIARVNESRQVAMIWPEVWVFQEPDFSLP